MSDVETQERAGAVRVVSMENITHRNRRSEGDPEEVYSLADVAMALDLAWEESIQNHGGSGTGAGAFLEALIIPEGVSVEDYMPDEDDDCQRVETWRDPLFAHLPGGDKRALRRFIRDQARSTVWNGNNHVPSPSINSEELLEHLNRR